jgi:aldose 1-epimerase
MIEDSTFGIMKDGTAVRRFRITNHSGSYVEILSYGAAVHSIHVPDRYGNDTDVTLGTDDVNVLDGRSMEGQVMGRIANRVAGAEFSIGAKTFHLDRGRGGNCLHSGSGNWGKRIFTRILPDAGEKENKNGLTLRLACEDHGEGGFESYVHVEVDYTWTEDNQLNIEYIAVPGETTAIMPTNHTYFNLGCVDARDHYLKLASSKYLVRDENGLSHGRIASVENTPFDFRESRTIRSAIGEDPERKFLPKGEFDDCCLLDGKGFREVGELFSEESGIAMRVFTDMPSLILFTPFIRDRAAGKNGSFYEGFTSVCLETEIEVDAVNCAAFTSPIVNAGSVFHSVTSYRFERET